MHQGELRPSNKQSPLQASANHRQQRFTASRRTFNSVKLQKNEINPLIIPSRHHISTLLTRHHHEKVKHQGRHLTEGAIRAIGLWIVGAKRCISGIIHKCVTCRKLRGRIEQQQMADLPAERLQADPPFSYVGLDVFRTLGGNRTSHERRPGHQQKMDSVIHMYVYQSHSH